MNGLKHAGSMDLITWQKNLTSQAGWRTSLKALIFMHISEVDYSKVHQLSQTDIAYIRHDDRLRDFYQYEPLRGSIPEVITSRKKFPVDRSLLWRVLRKQYEELDRALPVSESVLMNENTFTITTAHQPTLLTGPLFHIYKIASIIHLAGDLNEQHPEHRFLPVFVMSGEDHDWAEVNHFHLFGKRYEWEREAKGACGHLSTEGLDEVIKKVNALFENVPFGKNIKEILESCLSKAKNYGHFHRLLISTIFQDTDLIVIDLDDREFKEAFIPVFKKEINERFSHRFVTATQGNLEKKGFKIQAHCRPVNLFYMTDTVRERIDVTENGFIRVGSGVAYTEAELIEELHKHPERFSPNVIIRPLYQESILPNIAYTGGGGEIAYWLERKDQFEHAGVHYPMLIRRNSLMLIDKSTSAQLKKLDITPEDLFNDEHALTRSYLQKHSQNELTYDVELQKVNEAYKALAAKAEKIDPTLSKAILAEEIKQSKTFEQLGSRLLRAEKQQQDTQLKKIQRIREKLFPHGGLQERHENFLSFYGEYGPQFIDDLVKVCDPWKEKFILGEPAP